jgi:iron complex outermembrane receptor protein
MCRRKDSVLSSTSPCRVRGNANPGGFILPRVTVIFPAISLLFILAFPGVSGAQQDSDSLDIRRRELPNIIVTARQSPIEARQLSRTVTIISRSEIERSPVHSLDDLLRYVASADSRQRGPLGAQADISIRGGTCDQTLILLNGVNINDPQTGHHNLSLPVDIESIERVEIIRGPAAKSFGPNAFDGAINIITGNNKRDRVRVSLMAGEHSLYNVSGNISVSSGNLGQYISMYRSSSGGYIKNTDFTRTTLFYQANYTPKIGVIDFQAGYCVKDFGANSFYSLRYPDQFESIKTAFASLKYQSSSKIKFSPVLYYRANLDRFELKRDNDSVPFNHHRTGVGGLNLNASTANSLGKTSIGIDFRHEHIFSTVLGNLLNSPAGVKGYENTYYTRYYYRLNTSIYAEHSLTWKIISINAGVMAYHNRELEGFRFYPGIDLNCNINTSVIAYCSANKTSRMPSFTDMFYKSPVQQGYQGLKPEEAFVIETGMKYNDALFKGYISAFHRSGSNIIDWVKDPSPDSLIWRSANYSRVNFTGIECSLTITPRQGSLLDRIESSRLSYTCIKAERLDDHDNILSKYALDYLRHQFIFAIDSWIALKLYFTGRLVYNDREGVYQDTRGQLVSYEPFWLSDTRISWKADRCIFFAEASNIFNTGYFDFGGVTQPGRWIRAGVTMELDYRGKKDQQAH